MVAAAAGAAAANADGSARKALTFSVSGKVYSVSTDNARTRLYPLMMECGTEATVGYPICRHTLATLRTPSRKRVQGLLCDVEHFRVINAAVVKHLLDDQPEGEGEMFSMFSSVASLAPTLSPVFISCTSLRISMVPLEIFVVMPKAWKKEVFSGPRPVF